MGHIDTAQSRSTSVIAVVDLDRVRLSFTERDTPFSGIEVFAELDN